MRGTQLLVILLLVALTFAGERVREGCCTRMSALLRAAPLPLVGGLRTFTALTGEQQACTGAVITTEDLLPPF